MPMPGETMELLVALSFSMLLGGGIVGALSIGFILARFNRRNSMIIMNATNVVGVVVLVLGGCLIPSYEAVIIGRFIMGLFAGFGMSKASVNNVHMPVCPMVQLSNCYHEMRKIKQYLSLIGCCALEKGPRSRFRQGGLSKNS